MAQNRLPDPVSELLSLAALNLSGITTQGATIGLLQWTAANFGPKVTALQDKQVIFDQKRALTLAAFDALHAAQAVLRTRMLTGRKMLSVSWGEAWTTEWAQAGWTDHSTAVPAQLAALKTLATAVKTLLVADSTYEVSTARIDFTGDTIINLLAGFAALETAVATAKSAQKQADDDRQAADGDLRGAMRSLIGNLTDLLDPNSPKWDDFGLNRPGATTTPGQPAAPTLTKTGPTTVTASVPAVALATYYRWKTKIVGFDPEYRFAGRTNDPNTTFTALPATGSLEVICEAANEAGPGVASPKATLVLA